MNINTLRDTLRFLVVWASSLTTFGLGIYGLGLAADTAAGGGWQLWGMALFVAFIAIPVMNYWIKQFIKLFGGDE